MTTVPAREGIIYGLSCTCHPDDGIRYVGQTVNPKARLSQHRNSSRHPKYPVSWWVGKHGMSNIRMTELARGLQGQELNLLEVEHIANLRTFGYGGGTGLNMTIGGSGTKMARPKKGGAHHSSILTDDQALAIYNLVKEGRVTQRAIAKAYDIHPQIVTNIIQGKSYSTINQEPLPWRSNGNIHMRGVLNQNSKLTDEQVIQIHSRYSRGESSTALGEEFEVHSATVLCIVRADTHKYLNLPNICRGVVDPPAQTGEANHGARLNETQVREAHARALAGEDRESLSAEYGVTLGALQRILTGKTWKHLNLEVVKFEKVTDPATGRFTFKMVRSDTLLP